MKQIICRAIYSKTGMAGLVIFLFVFAVFLLSCLPLDFMVMSPLGNMLMKSMNLSTAQSGLAVSG